MMRFVINFETTSAGRSAFLHLRTTRQYPSRKSTTSPSPGIRPRKKVHPTRKPHRLKPLSR